MPDFTIETLGKCTVESPLGLAMDSGSGIPVFVPEDRYICYDIEYELGTSTSSRQPAARDKLLEVAGPRRKIYFSPSHVHAGIVTCGGLCPGMNDVIRSIVRSLWHLYGVRRISGIQYGYKGLLPDYRLEVVPLDPDLVDDIHKIGGTMLGTSRGGGDRTSEIVDTIEQLNLNILFTIGGDGTQKGALAIAEEIEHRGLKIAVVGIPKTIDNDIEFVEKTFGFDTAVVKASEAVAAAHMEAHSQINGIGLVKLMGRDSGFIAVQTVLAVHEANFVLIPEVPFDLEGPQGFLSMLEERIARTGTRGHCRRGGCRAAFLHAGGRVRRFGQQETRRYRAFSEGPDPGIFPEEEHRNQPQIHRSQLHDSLCDRRAHRFDVLRAPRQQRGACRDGRQDQDADRTRQQRVCPHPDTGGDVEAQTSQPRREPMARRNRGDPAAGANGESKVRHAIRLLLTTIHVCSI